MFKFHKLALNHAKPQNAKILMFTIVSFIILFALTVLTFMPVQPAIYKMLMSMAMQQPIGGAIFSLVLALLIPLIVFIFIGYPLIAGTIYTIDKAINKDKVNFKDLLSTFKKGRYLKGLKLSLITLIFVILAILINLVVSKVLNLGVVQLFSALQGSLSSSDHALGFSLTYQIIAATLILFIQSFIYWFFAIITINYTLAFVKEPSNGAWSSVKQGFKGIKNGKKTWFKFYLGLLLLNLLVILLANPISQLVSIFTGSMSQTIATVITYIVIVIVIIVRLIIYYTNILAIIQYYNRNGERIESSSSKKSKRNNSATLSSQKSKVNSSVSNTTEKTTSNVTDKSEELQDKVKDETTDLKNNLNNKEK
ncbi:hypothetical protein [Staphylococcus edaphicus]|uniref:DUF975 family protein n=1 Tax=Staphylococcus edaphicus TaxID=1955013 RepID=A0A2C6WE13_9STAP|nr:hypothetical protein [Staphylococcus edaphicus]PHK49068.1 hypothetical protein BTJ66_09990 [Staphylococcus edaphicus]UQW82258.1 DUF975 family protein [Staphylococcus edaphicus]